METDNVVPLHCSEKAGDPSGQDRLAELGCYDREWDGQRSYPRGGKA